MCHFFVFFGCIYTKTNLASSTQAFQNYPMSGWPTKLHTTKKETWMAAKILANLIVMGSGILARAFVQAYRQALANASKSGVAQETIQNAVRRGSKVMTEEEARQILGVTERSTWEEILQKYDNLFERNAKNGSFYLQSKVHRAKECLETVYRGGEQGTAG
ncbi:hypothetical protein F0562_006054 [Nyssa sinensis]|uniref:Uncharacterized protein n=1 Tax=Nyssa sinensis TaxID=561372 RepID=A0A5J5AJU5_9ASTE|nr:hypothetical protein F0562_006054 [Nyssa sinensis]